ILLRHLVQDVPEQAAQVTNYFKQIEDGTRRARISELVIFETVFILEQFYNIPKAKIREALVLMLALRGLVLPGKRRLRQVLDLYAEKNLPLAYAYHAVLMQELHLTDIVSFAPDFDRIPEITRVEP